MARHSSQVQAAPGPEAPPRAAGAPDLLRFLTCGSVDDGKSTLIGRLLHECDAVPEDQLDALQRVSRLLGSRGTDPDFALLVDGLAAERQQGITIDVAHRFFSTARRAFVVADTPGHEEYTRNMVTGASTADLAVLLLDARKGLLTQTRRHSYLATLLGIREVVQAINKMVLVGFSQEVFARIELEYREFVRTTGTVNVTCIPLSAVGRDNVVERSARTPWYRGPTLLEHLEGAEVAGGLAARPSECRSSGSPDRRGAPRSGRHRCQRMRLHRRRDPRHSLEPRRPHCAGSHRRPRRPDRGGRAVGTRHAR